MKSVGCALQAHMLQENTTLAVLWKVKRIDGTIFGFTNHDEDLDYDDGSGDGAVIYQADTGVTANAKVGKDDLSVDNQDATAFLDSSVITEDDIRAGKYDYAQIELLIVNWSDLSMGHMVESTGNLGVVTMKNGAFTAELRGLAHKLQYTIGRTYGPLCRAQFGSGLNGIDLNSKFLCNFDVTTVRQTGTIASIVSSRKLALTITGTARGADYFDEGLITFTSGALSGVSIEIQAWDGTNAVLFLPLRLSPAPGDAFTIEPGCNKTKTDCRVKYNNVINFRGEDAIPGMDQILQYPGAG